MCGIVGYIGNKKAVPILIGGLERLEYRGYDSAGLAILESGNFSIFKKKGKVSNLKKIVDKDFNGSIGIAHTRWATHGEPSDINSHPHTSNDEKIALVHNGIVENYATLKKVLEKRGYIFKSETDTEVIANLIQEFKKENKNILEAVRLALSEIIGTYGLVVLDKDNPNQILVARKGSPIAIGIGKKEFFVASDAAPIISYTKKVFYLDDNDIAVLRGDGTYDIRDIKNNPRNLKVQELKLNVDEIEKTGFEHFMLKEIFEQPKAISDSIRGRINIKNHSVVLGGIKKYEDKILNAKRIIFVACGTSWHAALTGEYFIEELARKPVEVEYASEFRYRDPIINSDDVVIAISQSGETADTLAAIQIAKEKGATVLGVCNVVGSSIARLTDAGIYTHAGHEIGVASTKAFTTQLSVLFLLAVRIGILNKQIDSDKRKELLNGMYNIPSLIEKTFEQKDKIFKLAKNFKNTKDVFYLGREYAFPTALEGALKLKEISYIHAEGYPAAEMKHGPIALIDKKTPVIFIVPDGKLFEKVLSNMQEIKARGGYVIAITNKNNKIIKSTARNIIEISKTSDIFVPFLAIIPLQLLAYKVALIRGCDVDKPRNLAKSVTVE